MRERLRQQPIRKPRVAGEQRTVEVGADGSSDAAERLGADVQMRAAGVVLEAGERPLDAGLELALDQAIADHACAAGDGVKREDAGPGLLGAADVAVERAEELVAAADGEHRGSLADCLTETLSLRGQIGRNQRLLTVLAAAHVIE